jgi:hypothetical protein
MQSIVDTFNSALEDGIYKLDIAKREEDTNNIVEFLDMHLNEIVNLTVKCLVAVRMRLDRKNMSHNVGITFCSSFN